MSNATPALAAIILAAGKGTRMKSALPKVLHPLLGRAMVTYPVQAALDAGAEQVVVVVGHGAETVIEALRDTFGDKVTTALQANQRGTGDAARCGAEALPDFNGQLLILNGDAPLIRPAVLRALAEETSNSQAELGLLVSTAADTTGYGRILRNDTGHVVHIREQKDCSAAEADIKEWNPGVYAISAPFFRKGIGQLNTNNAQGELLLTDLVAMAADKRSVADVNWPEQELHGVNDRGELNIREQVLRKRIIDRHVAAGVTIRDPQNTVIDADVTIESDVTLQGTVHIRGKSSVASGTTIDTGCILNNAHIGANTTLLAYTLVTDSSVGQNAQLGPFSHLRPGNTLGDNTRVGNFVEMKKTSLGTGSKANHLAYLGDGIVGNGVNVGAGTIFCNYDGFNKAQTILEDDVFIGSDSQLVAPVRVGKGAYVGTGTTVTQDVPPDALAVSRTRQSNKEGLASRLKAKFKAMKEAANR